MAYVTIPGGLWYPNRVPDLLAFTSFLLDATAEKFAIVFTAPKTGDLDRFEFGLGAVTQAPTSGLACSFQTLDMATGNPDGTPDETVTITTGLTANAWVDPGAIRLTGTPRAVTRGDFVCAVIEFAAFAASDSLNIRGMTMPTDTHEFPYNTHFTAAWAKSRTSAPNFALKYTDGSYYSIGGLSAPISALTTVSGFDSGDTPDERAMIFQSPFTVAAKVGEVVIAGDFEGTVEVVLYDSDGSTVLETLTFDSDVRGSSLSGLQFRLLANDRILQPATNYRLSIKPGTAMTVFEFDVATAAHFDAYGGQTAHFSSRTNVGAWTETTTKRQLAFIKFVAIDITAGGGGGMLVHPGMAGGLRG